MTTAKVPSLFATSVTTSLYEVATPEHLRTAAKEFASPGFENRTRSSDSSIQPPRPVQAPNSYAWSWLAGGQGGPASRSISCAFLPLVFSPFSEQIFLNSLMFIADRRPPIFNTSGIADRVLPEAFSICL